MKKIQTVFIRNPENMREILNEPHPDCQWVFDGEGVATRKYDGTCVKIEDGKYFKRREVKKGKVAPPDFIEEEFDKNTGKRVGWVPVDPDSKEDCWHMEAFSENLSDGTYELVGPKIQGNPEGYNVHALVKHEEAQIFEDVPRTFDGIANFMSDKDIEGIVFHHTDGRMAKLKKKDFGQKRV
ncbi:MAG: DUF5565 family protein [Candidatus Hodarchaeota archaeon]